MGHDAVPNARDIVDLGNMTVFEITAANRAAVCDNGSPNRCCGHLEGGS